MTSAPSLSRVSLAAVLLACGVAHAESESEGAGHTDAHPVHVAAFVGAVTSEHGSGPAAGLDVERRFGRIGMALVIDSARVEEATVVTVVPAAVVHPWRGAKVLGGAGWERSHGHDELVLRAGAGYDVHLGSLSFGPSMAVDWVAETAVLTVGASVGAGF